MTRHENRSTPKIVGKVLYTDDAFTGTVVGCPAWFTWLSTATTFFYESPLGTFTAHQEHRQRGGLYWIAYRRQNGHLSRSHLGKSDQLTLDRLVNAAALLSIHTHLT